MEPTKFKVTLKTEVKNVDKIPEDKLPNSSDREMRKLRALGKESLRPGE